MIIFCFLGLHKWRYINWLIGHRKCFRCNKEIGAPAGSAPNES